MPAVTSDDLKQVADKGAESATIAKHPKGRQDTLQRGGLSRESELTPEQAERADNPPEGMDGTTLGDYIMGKPGAPKGTRKSKHPARVLEAHASVLAVAKRAGMGKLPVPKQTANVMKAVKDADPVEASGLSLTALRKWALKGERPKDAAPMSEFIAQHKPLKNDANLGPRKAAVILLGISEGASSAAGEQG